jgi:hypothetical protein
MANPVLAPLSSAVAFAYGILTMILYFLMSVKNGLFFEKPTKEFQSELDAGVLVPFVTNWASCC